MFCSKCGTAVDPSSAFCPSCGQPVESKASVPVAPAPVYGSAAPPVPPFGPSATATMYTGALPPVNVAPTRTDYAGFWLRFVAYIIDALILGIPIGGIVLIILVLTGAFGALSSMHVGDPPDAVVGMLGMGIFGIYFGIITVGVVGGWLYYAYCESSTWQGTLGKKALGLIVTDLEGRPVTFGRASGRFFSKIITGLIPFGIGYMLAGFTAKKQALHDMIASCLVLRRI
jgi:uncharacterized RDD family membrane protein YckC